METVKDIARDLPFYPPNWPIIDQQYIDHLSFAIVNMNWTILQ